MRIGRSSGAEVTCRIVGEQTEEVRDFLAREWPAADLAIFGREVSWTSSPVVVEAFCARAAELGAARCFLRCPDTERHRRFYVGCGFVQVASIPRYYHDMDFLEFMREPLASG